MNIKLKPNDGSYRTQEKAIAHHNQLKEPMMSFADMVTLVKDNNIQNIESLREDFKERWIVTSTRIIYSGNNLSAKLIHNADSKYSKEKVYNLKEIPDYNHKLEKVLKDKAGLEFIRALLDRPKYTPEQICDFFTKLTGKELKKIYIYTPDQSSRANKQIRSVGVYFGGDWFNVGAGGWFGNDSGLSRGVVIDSAKQSKFYSKKAVFDIEEEIITIPMTKKLRKEIERVQKTKKKVKITWHIDIDVQ